MKTAPTLAALALTVGGLAGCGGDDSDGAAGGLPTDASTEEFCGAFQDFAEGLGAFFGADFDPAEAVRAMQDGADAIRETGVPESAGDEEIEGLEVTLDAIDSLDEDTTREDLGTINESLSDEEQEKAEAFDDYLESECGDLG